MALPKAVQEQADKAAAIQNRIAGNPPVVAVPDDNNPAPASDQVDWEKRFKGMKKAHDKTVTELRNDKEELLARIEALESKPEVPDPPAAQAPTFTQAEIEEYGQEFLDMVTRVAEAKSAGTSTVASELKELQGKFDDITQSQVRSREEEFYDYLNKAVPDWEDINEDENFHAWLADDMPLTGRQRQVFLTDAQKKFDAKTVASFFISWKGRSGDASHYPDTTTTSNVLPDDGEGGDKVILSRSAVTQFYDDCKLGKYKGQDELKRQIEMKIFRATSEGRVR